MLGSQGDPGLLGAQLGQGIFLDRGARGGTDMANVQVSLQNAVPQAAVACHRLRLGERLLDAFDLGGSYRLATVAQVGDPPRLVVEGHQAHRDQQDPSKGSL